MPNIAYFGRKFPFLALWPLMKHTVPSGAHRSLWGQKRDFPESFCPLKGHTRANSRTFLDFGTHALRPQYLRIKDSHELDIWSPNQSFISAYFGTKIVNLRACLRAHECWFCRAYSRSINVMTRQQLLQNLYPSGQ